MTVKEFTPRFTNENNWACCSVDDSSPWCLSISDCIWDYMDRFYDIECEVRYCEWPLDRRQFESGWYKERKLGCSTYEEYLKKDPKVIYDSYPDVQFYGLLQTDSTCDFAYQNEEWIFIIHIDGYEGFGCVIGKQSQEIHCVRLAEDDGNYWGDHDILGSDLSDYDWGIIGSVVNDLNFPDKEKIIEKIFKHET